MEQRSLLNAALEYAACGFPVLPVIGKQPAISNGFYRATTDSDQIYEWWCRADFNIGIRTGVSSGLWVLDVDIEEGGSNGFRTLSEIAGGFEWTRDIPFQVTGSGGVHFFFKCSDEGLGGSIGKIGPGLDVRANGGYIVASPSIHPETSRQYSWKRKSILNSTIPDAPAWLFEMANRKPKPLPMAQKQESFKRPPAYGEAALKDECQKIRDAENGFQHQALNNAAFKVGKLIAKGDINEFVAEQALKSSAARMVNYDRKRPWSQSEIDRVISKAISDGKKSM